MRFFDLPKKRSSYSLLYFLLIAFFNDNSLQRHEFPPKFLAKYGWTKQIGVIYAITETSVQAPKTEPHCSVDFAVSLSPESALYTETSHLSSFTWPDTLLRRFISHSKCCFFWLAKAIFSFKSLFSLFNSCNSSFRLSFSFWSRKQENKFKINKIQMRWYCRNTSEIKNKQTKTGP